MEAKCPKRASFTWNSTLYGRDLLKEGLVWRIGDGSKVKIWEDNWISRDLLVRLLGHRPDVTVTRVGELLSTEGGRWNEEKLRDTFFQGNVEDILKIPIGHVGT
jgi:hypothetical protein